MLNENYYNKLINKYSISQDCNIVGYLTTSTILANCRGKNVHLNFPKRYDLKEITIMLFEVFSKQIFTNHAYLKDFSIGDKLKRKGEKGNNIYIIKEIIGSDYILIKDKDESNLKIISTFDRLNRNYTQIKQSTRNSTLSKYESYFKDISDYGFLPTHFSSKIVLIAGQIMWNNLKNKDCIPTIYLPNTRDGEQTEKRSIEALEDCITYITPKYEVCYEEILKKNIVVDTIVVCGTDLNSLSQILQDQSKYQFKLIVLSNESEVQKVNNIYLWNWHKEEINLLQEKTSNKIDVNCIQDNELDTLIQHFEDCIKYISSLEFPIKLNSYGYFLRLALNAIQEEQFDDVLWLLKRNKELERNDGGYEDFADKDPKNALKALILYLKNNNYKHDILKKVISSATKNLLLVVENRDKEFLLKSIRSSKCKIITNAELKKLLKSSDANNKTIVFYSFNGSKDFDYIYNLPNYVQLILYKQEKEFYLRQLQAYQKRLETELTREDRFSLCGIKYEPIIEQEIKVSPTLEQIIERLEKRSNVAYYGYKDESDSLLDDLEEKITYRITFNDKSIIELESNETVFDAKGNLLKTYKLHENKKIRIYPKDLAENLIEIAIAEEPEIFGKVEEHSALWKNALKKLENKYIKRENLYDLLKQKGLRVLPATVDAYFRGNRKFPMFNTDLKAILELSDNLDVFSQLKKSKKLYISTTIALGRGVKQELKQFIQQKTLGDILTKKQFSKETLQKFIDEKMPLLTITKIEEVSDEQ
ncbi:MAG: hypothetical protein FWH18_04305 [Marinilabiliaceae bacterium]|nr:hypothetical protein [Marinilabiliaceae bacterium]